MEANLTDQDFIDQKEIAEILSVKPSPSIT